MERLSVSAPESRGQLTITAQAHVRGNLLKEEQKEGGIKHDSRATSIHG